MIDVARMARAAQSREQRARGVAALIRATCDGRWAGVYDVTSGEVLLLGYAGDAPPAYPRFPRDAGLMAIAVASGAPIVSDNVRVDARYLTAFANTGSEAIVPVLDARGRAVGTLDVESDRRQAFGPDAVARLVAFARDLAPLFTDVSVRTATPDDAAACAAIYAPFVETTAVSFEDEPPDAAEMARRIRTTLERTPWLAATNGSDVVGYAYGSRHRDRSAYRFAVDVSAYVHERFRGRGAGSALYARLLSLLERQGFRRAYAGIALPNPGSVALHRRAGFEEVGVYRRVGWKHGAWHDVAWFGRTLGADDDAPPAEPTPFARLPADED